MMEFAYTKLIMVGLITSRLENVKFKTCVGVLMAEKKEEVILIGKKPTMNYVVACLTVFNTGKQVVTVRARGSVIPRAVDTVELLRRAFIKDLKVQKIVIGSQEFENFQGFRKSVSTMDIVISKSQGQQLHSS